MIKAAHGVSANDNADNWQASFNLAKTSENAGQRYPRSNWHNKAFGAVRNVYHLPCGELNSLRACHSKRNDGPACCRAIVEGTTIYHCVISSLVENDLGA
nr:hypothetical protein [Bradyrhizobium sp. SRS-191]